MSYRIFCLLFFFLIIVLSSAFPAGPEPTPTPSPTPTPYPSPTPTATPVVWHKRCQPYSTCTNAWAAAPGDYCKVCDGGGAQNICHSVATMAPDECGYGDGTTWWAICSPRTKYCRTYTLPGDPPGTIRCNLSDCPITRDEECGRWVCL